MEQFAEECRRQRELALCLEAVWNLNYVPQSTRLNVCLLDCREQYVLRTVRGGCTMDDNKVTKYLIHWGLSDQFPESTAVVGCASREAAVELAKELGAQHVYAEGSDGLFYRSNVVWRSSWAGFSA